jgi:hypothetical protein
MSLFVVPSHRFGLLWDGTRSSGTVTREEISMPLRDHFHSPVNDKHRWDAVHGGWPMEIVRTLFDLLPPGFVAEPKIHHGSPFEVDVSMVEDHDRRPDVDEGDGGTATLTAAPPPTVPADLSELDEYEIRIYDVNRDRTLVAAIEIVSPANKDRPETRDLFINKVDWLLRQGVCVSIVDIVTNHQTNLYAQLLARYGQSDPRLGDPPTPIYAVTLLGRRPKKRQPVLDLWCFPLVVGQPLPAIPLWLDTGLVVSLPLEPNYQEVCRLLRIA